MVATRLEPLIALLAVAAFLLSGCSSAQNASDVTDQVGVGGAPCSDPSASPGAHACRSRDRCRPRRQRHSHDASPRQGHRRQRLGVVVRAVPSRSTRPQRGQHRDHRHRRLHRSQRAREQPSGSACLRPLVRSPVRAHLRPGRRQLLAFAGELSPNAIPSTLIIDREGRTAVRIVGTVTKTTLVQMIRDVSEGR